MIKSFKSPKGQLSIYFIIGIIAIVAMYLFFSAISSDQENWFSSESRRLGRFSEMRIDYKSYVESCARDAVMEAISDTGIREDTLEEHKAIVASKTKECAGSLFDELKVQGYNITEGVISISAAINEDTLVVQFDYPISIRRDGQTTDFNSFLITFDRSSIIRIKGGITDKETRIESPDRRAELVIPGGVTITDSSGNPVEYIQIKVLDLHFETLENKVVIGNLVFDAKPDGTKFSKPVQLAINIRDEDIPAGVLPAQLFLGWWDDEFKIWRAVPTAIEGNRLYANISHFSPQAVVRCTSYIPYDAISVGLDQRMFSYFELKTGKLFEQRFSPCEQASKSGEKQWQFSTGFSGQNMNAYTIIAATHKEDYYTDNHYSLSENGEKLRNYKMVEYACSPSPFCFTDANKPEVHSIDIGVCSLESVFECLRPISTFNYEGKQIGENCGQNSICISESGDGGKCSCINTESISKENILGYCDSSCVGGIVDLGEQDYVAAFRFEGNGNSCIFMYSVYAECDKSDMDEEPESCKIIPYNTELFNSEGVKEAAVDENEDGETDYMEIRVRGIQVLNENKDACAWGKAVLKYTGVGKITAIQNNLNS